MNTYDPPNLAQLKAVIVAPYEEATLIVAKSLTRGHQRLTHHGPIFVFLDNPLHTLFCSHVDSLIDAICSGN